jgi:N-acetyl-gamma-glutamyl-phosphate reductase
MTAAVAGASGYAGGELLRLLLDHPHLELGALTAGSHAGDDVASVHPHLTPLAGTILQPTEAAALQDADIVFLALPHGASAALVQQLTPDTRIVDLGADYRLAAAGKWQDYYGGTHAGTWPYGLPELSRTRSEFAGAIHIANPGCFPTAVILALAPLLAAGLVEPADVVVVAASGTTGAGRAAKPHLLGSEVMGSMSAYKAGGAHQHTPEMEQALSGAAGAPVTISFTPTLAPMPRGILATCTARLAGNATTADLRAAVAEHYEGEPFVTLLPEGRWPGTAGTLGSNAAHLQVAADPHSGRAVAVAAIDNLGKGASGQAIQNANILLGLPETAGLPTVGVAP